MDNDKVLASDDLLTAAETTSLLRRINRPVALVGMMGVGKTSVGKRLAAAMHCPFVDADEEIETAARMTIAEMFSAYGEPYFRDGERRVIARLIEDGKGCKVIATGGGAFCQPDTRALILDKAIAVWLDSDIETLLIRTARKDNRPLLQGGDRRETLTRLREERRPAYSQAPIHIISHDGPHAKTVDTILRKIDQWL
jgi:shikimate kinase